MALQSILHDPNISTFLDQIPQNQHIITLKQLIYIGIKIVSNSFNTQEHFHNPLLQMQNKQNKKPNTNKHKQNKKSISQNFYKISQNDKKFKKSKNSHNHTFTNKTDKIQSTLLRQISKIRLQLQSLTNKVYDHYFDQNQQTQSQDSLQCNAQKQSDYVQSRGFKYPQDIPTFSPPRQKPITINSYASNPFLKQKNNFFNTQNNRQAQRQSKKKICKQARQSANDNQQQQRCRAKSNIMHLDDTQIRQALYKQNNEESEVQNISKRKQKKSQSLIQKRHQEKKKDQQNYFYQLNIDKQNLKELQKFKQSKNLPQPDASYRDFIDNKPPRVDFFKKKAKSKIKQLVQRDRLKYQSKVEEQNYKKGLEQYEYSANEIEDNQQEQNNSQEESQQAYQQTYNQQDNNLINEVQKQKKTEKQQQNFSHSQYGRQINSSNPNFGFYGSKHHSFQNSRRQNTFNNNQKEKDNKINLQGNDSSFSEFSEFSMSSSNSKRQNGKISRKKQE